MKHPMTPIEKRKRDLSPDLYVNLIHQWKAQRPHRTRGNVVRFPAPTQQQEEPISDGLTAGGVFAILLAFLALTAVLIALGAAG